MRYVKIIILLCTFPFLSLELRAQSIDEIAIESRVFDSEENPITGASVNADDGRVIRYTDGTGSFSITVPKNSTIHISAKGYINQSIEAILDLERVVLEKDTIGKLVNIAYRQIERRDVLGAVSVINPSEHIQYDYNYSVTDGMSGRVSGLLWANNIWGLQDALIMIDGVPRNFDDVRLDEVDQITVLKGINAVALYGSHAANGVILITTKRGEAHTQNVNVRINSGISTPILLPNYLSSAEYMNLYNEARTNDGLPTVYSQQMINDFRDGNPYRFPDVDYYSPDYLRSFTHNTDANAEFSGGNETARFYSNLGWANNTSLLNIGEGKNERVDRFNVRGNVDLRLNNYITSSIDASARIQNAHLGLGDYWGNASRLHPNRYSPLLPISSIAADSADVLLLAQNSRNIIDDKYILGGSQEYMENPIADLYVGGYTQNISRVLQLTNRVNVDLERLVEGLSFHTQFHADYYNSYNQSINNEYSVYSPTWSSSSNHITNLQRFGNDARPGNQNIDNTAQLRNMGFSTFFNYLRSFDEVHNLSAVLLASGTSISITDSVQTFNNTNLGLNIGYNYQHRYYVDLSSAVVNSTKLPEGNRLGFSPTIGVGWLLSAEDFLASSGAIDHLKLSASAGILNTDIQIEGSYLYDNIYTQQDWYSWNDGAYSNQRRGSIQGSNPDLFYAKRKEVNVALEGAFFNRLLWVESTLFLTQLDDIPTQRFSMYPNYYSAFVPFTNYNCYQYSGVDLLMSINRNVGQARLNLGVNATYVNSEVKRIDELYADSYQKRAGNPVDAIFGLENDGFFMDESDIVSYSQQAFGDVMPGDIKYIDQNGDNIINDRDEVMIGRWIAPFNFAMNLSLSYKNLTLFSQVAGSMGGNGMRTSEYYWVDGDRKYSEVVLDRWTPSTSNSATYPRLSSINSGNNHRYSNFWIYSTDRINISKLQLSYSIPGFSIGAPFLQDLSVYAMGLNLLTISKNKDILDLNIGGVPQFRHYTLGLRANF